MRSFWLCKKANRRQALKTKILKPTKGVPCVDFEISEPLTEKEVRGGTVNRAKASCVCCGTVLHPDRVRTQLRAQRGGADAVFDAKGRRTGGARMLAVVTLKSDEAGRHYRLPIVADYQAVWKAHQRLAVVAKDTLSGGLRPIPDEPLPPQGTLGFRVQLYGMLQWGDLFTARQKIALIHALGPSAKDAPPGTDTINRLVGLVRGPVLFLFDELLNLLSRHRNLGEGMHAFMHNIVRGFVGTNHRAAVFSLPKSQVEMTDFDWQWQERITKVVGAVAKPLLVNDEAEISEVVRRRLFEDLGSDRTRKNVAKTYADWCFERRNQLPPESGPAATNP